MRRSLCPRWDRPPASPHLRSAVRPWRRNIHGRDGQVLWVDRCRPHAFSVVFPYGHSLALPFWGTAFSTPQRQKLAQCFEHRGRSGVLLPNYFEPGEPQSDNACGFLNSGNGGRISQPLWSISSMPANSHRSGASQASTLHEQVRQRANRASLKRGLWSC